MLYLSEIPRCKGIAMEPARVCLVNEEIPFSRQWPLASMKTECKAASHFIEPNDLDRLEIVRGRTIYDRLFKLPLTAQMLERHNSRGLR